MNNKIKNHIKKYNKEHKYGIDDEDIIETITEAQIIYTEVTEKHRWWNDTFNVCNLNGLLIGYDWAETTGDMGIFDVGWEFDPKSICEVVEDREIKIVYKKI